MPFGLSNAPTTFQGLMNKVFQKFLRKYVLVFFDDILIYNQSIEDRVLYLRNVFVTMQDHQLLAKESKCFFGVDRIEYLGHFITKEWVSTIPGKIFVVQTWPVPVTIKQLRGFVGLAGYCRRFIQGVVIINKPLTGLLKKDNFKWSLLLLVLLKNSKRHLLRLSFLSYLMQIRPLWWKRMPVGMVLLFS